MTTWLTGCSWGTTPYHTQKLPMRTRAHGVPNPLFRKLSPANPKHRRVTKLVEIKSKPWEDYPQVPWGLPPMKIKVLLRFCEEK